MHSPSRRAFLGTSLAGLTAGRLFADDEPAKKSDDKKNETPADRIDSLREKSTETPAFQPNTLFLTWQRDPTTTMTIQWVGVRGEVADTTIRFASTKDWTWQSQPTITKPYHPSTDLKVFRAELTGLMPGTDYKLQIGKRSLTYRFRTMPAKATNTIHFVSGGDVGVNPHAVANNVQAARQDPMFAVVGGDLGYDNGRSVEVSLAFLRNYSQHMIGRDGRLIPLVTCIGNHEVDGSYGKPREKAPFFYALFDGLYPDTGYTTLDFGDYLSLVLLDTGHTSPIDGAQAEWLGKALRDRAHHSNVMVVNHVPAYPSYRNMDGVNGKAGTGELNRKHWVPLFEQYRVPVVLEHHDHTFKRSKPLLGESAHANGVLYLGDGSWGRLRTPKPPEKLPHIALMSKDYHLTLHRIQGEERFHLALDETGKVMDVARTGQRTAGLVRTTG
jgi:hypothetical protein